VTIEQSRRPGGLLVLKWSGTRPSVAAVLELFPVRPLWKQKQRDLVAIAAKTGVTAEEAAAALDAAGSTTWHHFEKPSADADLAELPLFAAG